MASRRGAARSLSEQRTTAGMVPIVHKLDINDPTAAGKIAMYQVLYINILIIRIEMACYFHVR